MLAKLVSAVIGILVCSALSLEARAELLPGSYTIASDTSGGSLNMRSGPGQGHSIVVAIPAGSNGVTIDQCRSPDDGKSRYDWCSAKWNGYSGWVSSSGIVREGNQPSIETNAATAAGQPAQKKCSEVGAMAGNCIIQYCAPFKKDFETFDNLYRKYLGWGMQASADEKARFAQSADRKFQHCLTACKDLTDACKARGQYKYEFDDAMDSEFRRINNE